MSQTTELFIDRETGRVTLRSHALGLSQPWSVTRTLLGRLLAASCVDSVVLDRSKETATIQLNQLNHQIPTQKVSAETARQGLQSLARLLRDAAVAESPISDQYASFSRLQLQKTDEGTAAGQIVHSLPGRVRIRHPLIRQSQNLCQIQSRLASIAGVKSVSLSSTTGSVLVLFEQATTLASDLLARLEQIVTLRDDQPNRLSGPPVSRWVASGACLGLAVTSEFFVPGLAPATAAALVGFNLPTMARGITELCTLRWKVASLYTVIMGTTLISGQFLAAAVMQASITCWHGWSSHRLSQISNRLRRQSVLPIVLCRSQQNLLTTSERFPDCLVGTVMTVDSKSTLPYDGVVVAGHGELDERCVRGTAGLARREVGDAVFAGTELLTGQLQVRITAVEKQTRVSKVRETLLASMAELPGSGSPTPRGHASASRFVPMTFATGTAALVVGDLTTLAAVLRPDYATGPSISERFGTLSSIGHLWDQGWLVKNAEILHELVQTETVVIFHGKESTGELLNSGSQTQDTIGLRVDPAQVRHRHVSLQTRHLDIYEIESNEQLCVNFVRDLRSSNRRVAVMANGRVLNQLASDDVIRISSTPDGCLWEETADLIALHSGPRQVEELWRVLQEARRPHQHGWAAVVACNALAISGAFLVGLTSLHVVVLTNVGALAASLLYDRHLKRSSLMLSPSAESNVESEGNDFIRDVEGIGQSNKRQSATRPAAKPNVGTAPNGAFDARMKERRSPGGHERKLSNGPSSPNSSQRPARRD